MGIAIQTSSILLLSKCGINSKLFKWICVPKIYPDHLLRIILLNRLVAKSPSPIMATYLRLKPLARILFNRIARHNRRKVSNRILTPPQSASHIREKKSPDWLNKITINSARNTIAQTLYIFESDSIGFLPRIDM